MRPTVMFLLLPLAVVAGIGQSEIKRRFFSSDNINEQSHVISYSDVYPAVDPNASTLYAQITNENINATCVEAKFEDFCEGKNVIFHKKFSVNNDGSSSYLTNDAVGTDDPYLNFHFQKPINALYDGAEIEIYGKIKKVSGRFFTVSDSRIVRLIKTKKQLQDAESAKQAQLDADIAANLKSFRQACYDAYSAAPVGASFSHAHNPLLVEAGFKATKRFAHDDNGRRTIVICMVSNVSYSWGDRSRYALKCTQNGAGVSTQFTLVSKNDCTISE